MKSSSASRPIILVHGGAGRRAMTVQQRVCLREALSVGYRCLELGAPAIDAVEASIRVLEKSGVFNAGRGANRQLDGVQRMDASIMEGARLQAGAVASVERIVHPITAARLVAEKTAHVLLVGQPGTMFARHFGLAQVPRGGRRRAMGRRHHRMAKPAIMQTLRLHEALRRTGRIVARTLGKETVGAVALDRTGTLAAGASTGGVDVMLPGRVGDTPLIGCGVYADNEAGAVSMTGVGESLIRVAVAKEIADLLAAGVFPLTAVRRVLRKVVDRVDGAGGALVLAPNGRFAIHHTTPHMVAGYWDGRGQPVVRGRF